MNSQTIVYPTDFSACAENAMEYAMAMAKALKCKIKIVHSMNTADLVKTQENPLLVIKEIRIIEKKTETRLKRIALKIQENEVDCKIDVITDYAVNWLPNYLKKVNPILVVMGTTGSNTLENKIMGSETYRVIKRTDVPVLAVPVQAVYTGIQKIIFATDYQKGDLDYLKFLMKIAKLHEAAINVVHVTDEVFDNDEEEQFLSKLKEEVNDRTNYHNLTYDLLYWKNVEERLEILLTESNANLLAMVNRKRDFIDRLFHKSVVKRMVYHTHVPLLIFS